MVPLDKNIKISFIHKDNKNKVLENGIEQGVPQSTLSKASLTVEAALVFPLFLLVMVIILFFFRVLQVTHITQGALSATGSWLILNAREDEEPVWKAVGYFQKELVGESFPDHYLMGGRAGIGFDGTSLDGEYVDLKIRYQCRLPVSLFGLRAIPIVQRVRMKKWTGYHKDAGEEGSTEEAIVYITPEGQVYHTAMDCTHLRLSTRIMGRRDSIAAGYTACQICGKEQGMYAYYYVTEEGKRYHTRLTCSGLKRTVYMVRISEAEGRSACSRCGGM